MTLTDQGYQKPTREEIHSKIIAVLQDKFGADIVADSSGNFGILANIMSDMFFEIEGNQEAVYNAGFITKARGVSLDRLSANYNIVRNQASYASVTLTITGTPKYNVPDGVSFRTVDGLIFITSNPVQLDDNGNGEVLAYANQSGAMYNVTQKSIKYQVERINDVISVINNYPAEGGADTESDSSLRERIKIAAQGINSGTYNGLMTAIRSVSGVTAVRIVENHTDKTDSYGTPPYCIRIFVLGGNNDNIARAIFDSIAVGINTYGSIRISVEDNSHKKHDVLFDKAKTVPIYGKILLHTTSEFPSDGVEMAKTAAETYIRELTMGSNVRFSYLFKYIYNAVPGIDFADVLVGLKPDDLKAENIKIDAFEVPVIETNSFEVEVANG